MSEDKHFHPRQVGDVTISGVSLLDYTAIEAMKAMLQFGRTNNRDPRYISETAYRIARAMTKAREATND